MIVDDIDYNIDLLKKSINNDRINYIEAIDGHEALNKLKTYKPDIIFLDIRMPGLSGYDIAEIIKNDEELKSIPLIAFTASVIRAKNDRIEKLFDGYLQKPVSRKSVHKMLQKYLEFEIEEQSNDELTDVISEDQINESISAEQLEAIKNHWEEWENIKNNLIIYEIEEFANKISELAHNYNSKTLSDFCSELNMGLQSFDIHIIEKKLSEFPEVVMKLEKIQENS